MKRKKMDVDGAKRIHLQEEIIMEILGRLPVQSLLRFKCVSKFWMTLISEPYFTMKHLNHAKNDQNSQKILVLNKEFSFHCSSLSSVQLFEDVQKLDWPLSGIPWSCKLYCCNDGLALIELCNEHHVLLLWNLSTGESIVLPRPEFPPEDFCTWGLGYDSTSDDYKIVKIDGKEHNEILSLKSGCWRKIDKHPTGIYSVSLSNMDSLAFVHGAFHCLGFSLENPVVSFSISNEVYGEMPLPQGMLLEFKLDCLKHGVSVLGGMLCVYYTHTYCMFCDYYFDLWVMKDYGVKESWSQLLSLNGSDLYSVIPKYMFSDGEVLLRCGHLKRDGSVFKTSNESSALWPQSHSEHIQIGFVYTESLISPKLLA